MVALHSDPLPAGAERGFYIVERAQSRKCCFLRGSVLAFVAMDDLLVQFSVCVDGLG